MIEPVYPLERSEFIAALASGHGRALIHAERFGTEGVRDAILDAALFPKTYDTQCNGYGEKWLARLCELAGLVETVISQSHGIEGGDGALRCEMLKEFALQGHEAARPALREMCRYDEEWGDLLASFQLVEVEGEEGFLFAADRMGERLLEDSDYWVDSALISMMNETAGEGRAMALLERESSGNPRIAAYREALLAEAEKFSEVERPPRPTTEEIIGMILTSTARLPRMMVYGEDGTDEERRKVAALDFTAMDPWPLWNYLGYFYQTGFPESREVYLSLLHHADEALVGWARSVLSHHDEPAVRIAAYEALERKKVDEFVKLLRSSGESEDTEPLLLAIDAPEILEDREERHTISSNLLTLVETNQRMTDPRLPEWIYRHSPCMYCRRGAVEVMVGRSTLPEWIAEECRSDASDQIREAVGGGKR